MDTRVLEYFLAVSEEENISHAASLLHVSQPTVSRQLMDLEEELGRKLFERTNKNIRLTEDGLRFRQTAKDILMLYDKAKHEPSESAEISGELYLGTSETDSFSFLADTISSFQKKYPNTCFHVMAGTSEEIRDAIYKGTVDLGLIIQSVNTMKLEVMDLDITDRWGILVRTDSYLASLSSVRIEDLREELLIIPENSHFQNTVREWMIDPSHIRCTYTMLNSAMLMVKAKIGTAICLETVKQCIDGVVSIPFTPERNARMLMVWKKKPVQTKLFSAFLDEIAMQIKHIK